MKNSTAGSFLSKTNGCVLVECWPKNAGIFICLILIQVSELSSAAPLLETTARNDCASFYRASGGTTKSLAVADKLRSLSEDEKGSILKAIESDPSLGKLNSALQIALKGDSELAAALKSSRSVESEFLISYMKWLAYRKEKSKIESSANNAQMAQIEVALQKTNIVEIVDQLVIRFVKLEKTIPPPILKLIFELMQGGAERIQVAADTHMLNGDIDKIVKTLEFLQHDQPVSAKELYLATMSIWGLDGGAPYAIQKNTSEFTMDEKLFFTALDPNSPLTLPTRHYTKMDVDAIRATYPRIPLSQLSIEQVDAAVAFQDRFSLSNQTMDDVQKQFPGRSYQSLTLAELESSLERLGQMTLTQRAALKRSPVSNRIVTENFVPKSFEEDTLVTEPKVKTENALALTSGSHPIAVAMTSRMEIAAYSNTASQLPGLPLAANRLETALAKLDHDSSEYMSSAQVYRTYLNLALFSPEVYKSGRGLYDALAVATVEVGGDKERAEFSKLVHENFAHILRKASARQQDSGGYSALVSSLVSLTTARRHWDFATLRFVLDKLNWLNDFESAQFLKLADAEAVLSEIQRLRRSEPPADFAVLSSILHLRKVPGETAKSVRFGDLVFDLTLAETSITNELGSVAIISRLSDTQGASSEFFHHLGLLEDLLRAQGFTGYQIVEPTLHLRRALVDFNKYTEVKFKKAYGQGGRYFRDESILFKSFKTSHVKIATAELNEFLGHPTYSRWVRVGAFKIFLKKMNVNMVSKKIGRTVTIEQIGSDAPGTGTYEAILKQIEIAAKDAGFVALIIEGVDNPRQWEFYSSRMKYQRHPRDTKNLRSYFAEL